MPLEEMSQVANGEINKQYPQNQWVRIHTDGSYINAIENGGAGVHIERLNGTTVTHSFPMGTHCSNYKAEATALEYAASLVKNSPDTATSQIVFPTDTKSVLQTAKTQKRQLTHTPGSCS
ncbi:reverse transcriptase [Plakobranchus ocellatus]|uniref:Reverse transcriptase n=1 Tax=Plakobranchus ocellatus TaxID=259542 RepID=A0AAV3ZL56_9GAST|nr:reverse transcriptase [Plakobranchus ocellatus]